MIWIYDEIHNLILRIGENSEKEMMTCGTWIQTRCWGELHNGAKLYMKSKLVRLRNYFCPIVNWYFGVATPPYTPAVFCFCCHNFFYIATFILYNGWGDVLVQTKLLKGHISTILGCNFLCKLDCKYYWKNSRLNSVCILYLSIRKNTINRATYL